MTISPPDVLLGCQTPRHLNVPSVVGSAGEEAVDLAASAGLHLDPWEQLVLKHSLGERADHKWAALEVALVVPRQNGKGAILEARELAGLFLFGERLILHSAHEFKTAQEAFLRIRSLIESTPDLERQVLRIRTASGAEGVELVGGQRLRFVARSGGSGRGFTGDLVIFDEAYEMSPLMMSALLPTLSARPNPQVWYTSSAPLAEERSDVLRGICKRGRAGTSRRLAYFEWCADDGVALDDRAAWAEANPGLGIRVSEEFIADVERQSLDDEAFGRERLGIWHEDETESAIPTEVWVARADPTAKPLDPVCFAVDVSPERSHAAIGMAGRDKAGRIVVEPVDNRPGTGWLLGRLAELKAKWRPAMVTLDERAAAGSLLQEFIDAGIEVEPVKTGDLVQACGAFYDDALEDRLRHTDMPNLNAAVAGAKKRYVGDAWAWHRKNSAVDITSLVAVTLARWAAAQREVRPPRIHVLKEATRP